MDWEIKMHPAGCSVYTIEFVLRLFNYIQWNIWIIIFSAKMNICNILAFVWFFVHYLHISQEAWIHFLQDLPGNLLSLQANRWKKKEKKSAYWSLQMCKIYFSLVFSFFEKSKLKGVFPFLFTYEGRGVF